MDLLHVCRQRSRAAFRTNTLDAATLTSASNMKPDLNDLVMGAILLAGVAMLARGAVWVLDHVKIVIV